MAASLKRMANIFPEWISLGRQGDLLQVSHEAFSEMSAQVIHYVGEYRKRVPQGIFKENDDFSAILKAIVDLDSGNVANSREAQLQSSSQDLKLLTRVAIIWWDVRLELTPFVCIMKWL